MITKTTTLTKSELNSLINRSSKSVEMFQGTTQQLIEVMKKTRTNEKVSIVIIR
jgi:hypothetical protein